MEVQEGVPLELAECISETLEAEMRVKQAREGEVRLGYLYLPVLGAAFLLGREIEGKPAERREIRALDALR